MAKEQMRFSYVHVHGVMDFSQPVKPDLPFNAILLPFINRYNASFARFQTIGTLVDVKSGRCVALIPAFGLTDR